MFDNWIHEPAYLSGMLAGGLTKTNVIGVVGGLPVPEVNRIVNAFVLGIKETNPDVTVVLGLRPFTAKAEILPEQVIGRGLRRVPGI